MSISDDSDTPISWAMAPLGELADVQLGKMLDRKRIAGTRLPYLRNINVRWGNVDTSDLLEMPFEDHELERFGLLEGDILVCEGGEPGRAAVWRRGPTKIKYQKALHRVRLRQGISPDWLVHNLYFDAKWGALARHFTGTTIAHLTRQAIREYPLRVAPLAEQERIVEAIESYFSRLDDAVATLERVERNLVRYRASVLKAAVEGRLVPTEAELARNQGRDYEPASVLLERILVERRRRWEQSGNKGKYKEPAPPDTTNLPDLPEGWCWTSIDCLLWDAGYGTSQKCTPEASGPAVLRIPNVQDQILKLEDMKFATGPAHLNEEGAVMPGDFLFIRTNGSRNLIGRGALVRDALPKPHHFASYLIRLRVLPVDALPQWLAFAWHTPVLREQILSEAASSAGQYNLGLKAANSFVVPLAPSAEQARILGEVERLTSLADAAMNDSMEATRRAVRLRQAILKWAFEGKLADQDPNDEPASVLLERIKAEREAHAAKPKKRRPRAGKDKTAQR